MTSWHEVLIWHAGLKSTRVRKDPPHKGIKITTGIGKSELEGEAIARVRHRSQEQRIASPSFAPRADAPAGGRGPEQDARRRHSSSLARPRKAIKLGTDEPMCSNIEAVKAALKIGAEIEEALSASTRKRAAPSTRLATIRHRRRQPKRPTLCLAAHEITVPKDVKAIGKHFGLIVVDEGFWQDDITQAPRLAVDRLDHELDAFPVRNYSGTKTRRRNHSPARPDRAPARRTGGHARRLCAARSR